MFATFTELPTEGVNGPPKMPVPAGMSVKTDALSEK
jgi:hypothetical protein